MFDWFRNITQTSLDSNTRLLEVGVGHGYFAEIADKSVLYEALEMSIELSERGKTLGYKVRVGDVAQMPDDLREQFDVCWMSHVLEHAPTWLDARRMLQGAVDSLKPGGELVIIAPDYHSWKKYFWDTDWSHGYPTTIRRSIQLLNDVGVTTTFAKSHRFGGPSLLQRFLGIGLCVVPHQLVDLCVTPQRRRFGEGYTYSLKTLLGWRQIFIVAKKAN